MSELDGMRLLTLEDGATPPPLEYLGLEFKPTEAALFKLWLEEEVLNEVLDTLEARDEATEDEDELEDRNAPPRDRDCSRNV